MTTKEILIILAKFDEDINAQWEKMKGSVTGLLFPQAAAEVKSQFSKWLEDVIYGDVALLYASPFSTAAANYNAEFMIRCDTSNNLSRNVAKGYLRADVSVVLFDRVWRWEFNTDEALPLDAVAKTIERVINEA